MSTRAIKGFGLSVLLLAGATEAWALDLSDASEWSRLADMPLPWLMALIAVATFVSEDLTCVASGL
ncbi:MAG: hypothetical protein AAF492_24775, partial [Verrucomicrobiota bacterium]